jgi:hypothetical protein
VVQQEQSLFSWRLFFIDAFVMLYLLVIFLACLIYAVDVTSTVVINAILK